jgi:hypothetical protein
MHLLWEAFKALLLWIIHAPLRFLRWLAGFPRLIAWFRNDDNHKEAWGYGWWGAAGIVIGVPELWAAFGGSDVLWPTISGTVGNLEVSNVWVALIVAGVLVWAGFHAVRVTKEKLRAAAVEAGSTAKAVAPTPVGAGAALVEGVDRFTQADATEEVNALAYLFFAVVAVAAPSAAFRIFYDAADRRYVFGEVLYASIAFWWLIVPGWLAYKRGYLVPYPSLFRTLKDLAGRAPKFTVVLVSGLLILLVHLILYPWPSTIPDTNRLHLQYKCHPLKPRSKPLDDEQKAACKKLDEANLRPPLDTP